MISQAILIPILLFRVAALRTVVQISAATISISVIKGVQRAGITEVPPAIRVLILLVSINQLRAVV